MSIERDGRRNSKVASIKESTAESLRINAHIGITEADLLAEIATKTTEPEVLDLLAADKASAKFGGAEDYTEFETDGTLLMEGKATVFNDIVCPLIVRTTGVGRPTLATMVGNIQQYTFAVNAYAEIEAIDLPHSWKEGSEVEIHVHWATGGLNDATVRGVKWEIEYAYAGMTGAYTTATTDSAEAVIAANEPAGTLHYTTVDTFIPTGYTIGTQMVLRLKRIASVTNTAPAADPFALAVGVHIEQDTIGSRERGSKANT